MAVKTALPPPSQSRIPTTQDAILVQSSKHVLSEAVPVPELGPQDIMIKVQSVAINPVDANMVELHGSSMTGCVAGYDFAGYVIAIGAEAEQRCQRASPLKLGDRVAGLVLGCNPLQPHIGAFCEYVLADPRFVVKLPDSMSFESGATLGVATAAAGMALYQSLKLAMPGKIVSEEASVLQPSHIAKHWILVIGGSTACGTMAVQLLKQSGYKVITTASPKNHDLVRSFGADCLIDYRSKTCALDIKAATNDSLCMVVDCVSNIETFKLSYEVMGADGGDYTGLNPFPISMHTRDDINPHWVFILPMFGQPIRVKGPYNRPKIRYGDAEFQSAWFGSMQQLLNSGDLKPHPVKLEEGGLAGIPDGIELMRRGMISGAKLVYSIK